MGAKMLLPLTALAFLAGCDGPQDYYPMEIGRARSYNVRTGFSTYVEAIVPRRVVSVAGIRGFEISSALGVSRLGWKDQTLYADRLANAGLNPPVPLLAPAKIGKVTSWSGTLSFPGGSEEATGTLTQAKSSVAIGGRKFSTIKTTLILDTPKRQIELDTDYAPGIGPVKQEQRTNGRFDLALELLAEK